MHLKYEPASEPRQQVAKAMKAAGFEIVHERDMALDPNQVRYKGTSLIRNRHPP